MPNHFADVYEAPEFVFIDRSPFFQNSAARAAARSQGRSESRSALSTMGDAEASLSACVNSDGPSVQMRGAKY